MYAIFPCRAERVVFLSRVPDLGVFLRGLCLGDLEPRGDCDFLEPLDDCDERERERCELRELREVERDLDLELRLLPLFEPFERAGDPLGLR